MPEQVFPHKNAFAELDPSLYGIYALCSGDGKHREVVGMEHLPLGGSFGAVKKFLTYLRRQDFFFYLFFCHKSTRLGC